MQRFEDDVIRVGIADLNIVQAPGKIRTSGLGSCVGVVIYDPVKQIAGLSHVMLPDASLMRQENFNPFKYADTAIDLLINKLVANHAQTINMLAKIAGGAQMFQHEYSTDIMRIGPRNVVAVKERLKKHQIALQASDVGGGSGRTIEFDPLTDKLKIRTVNKGETWI